MKIFITGATGFIGKNLINFYENWYNIKQYQRGEDLNSELHKFKPDIIINSAAEIYKEELMWSSNLVMVQQILEYSRLNGVDKIIQIGSSSEYGRKSKPSKEDDVLEPRTMYESTKAAATMLCLGYANTYQIPVVVARPYSVYGRYEKPHRLFPKLLSSFINETPMTLYQGYHDFIYIDDFVHGIDILVNSPAEKITGDIVNFGTGKQYSNFEILEIFQKIFKKEGQVKIENLLNKNFESEIWVCDTSYAKEKYNFEAEVSIEHGIFQLVKEETHDYRRRP